MAQILNNDKFKGTKSSKTYHINEDTSITITKHDGTEVTLSDAVYAVNCAWYELMIYAHIPVPS